MSTPLPYWATAAWCSWNECRVMISGCEGVTGRNVNWKGRVCIISHSQHVLSAQSWIIFAASPGHFQAPMQSWNLSLLLACCSRGGFCACEQGPTSLTHSSHYVLTQPLSVQRGCPLAFKQSFPLLCLCYKGSKHMCWPHTSQMKTTWLHSLSICVLYFCYSSACYIALIRTTVFRVFLPSIQFTNSSGKGRTSRYILSWVSRGDWADSTCKLLNMGACGNRLISESFLWVKWLWVGGHGCWKDELSFMEILYGSGEVLFSCMALLSSSDFYLFRSILKGRASQQHTAANIFVCVRVSWQFLGLWLVSQDWAYCFPKHLCCFSCCFLEPPGDAVRGPDAPCRHWCAMQSASA